MITAVYDKLNGPETPVTAALVRETAESMAALIAALPEAPVGQGVPAGMRLRTLDGNFLAGTDRRLACLRRDGAAALSGIALVVRDGRTGLLTDLIPREDAYPSERALCDAVLGSVRPCDLRLANRNFCTDGYLAGSPTGRRSS